MHSSSSNLLQALLTNPDFIAWSNGDRPEDDVKWNKWAGDDLEKQETIAIAREVLESFQVAGPNMTDEHVTSKVSQALNTAKRIESEQNSRSISPFRRLNFTVWNVAATLVTLLGLALAIFGIYKNGHFKLDLKNNVSKIDDADTFTEVTNQDQAVKYVRLSDGSAIVLHKNSSIRFPKQFSGPVREVFLTGDAFFEITKNPEQPFFVYANELVAKVHGTSFSIKAGQSDSKVIVAVKTGKVSVFSKNDLKADQYKKDKALQALVLTPNQQATLERSQFKLSRLALSSPILLNIPIENQDFTFSETPVKDVFEALEKAYGIHIDFNRETLAQCSITATLGDEPLENKLKWICTILEAEYAVREDKITIKGNPCNNYSPEP
ncbi:FecR family protein [Dyadobacter chenwenxiniae]|uniref:FecR family protein n=1 Tax=Dyadobacter chenwenxiniae TaxID=2906456 RepID=A0A9X1PRB3_9BACT|nr:FecR family protein [Dyadobacter chenwenxiniae]MCF0063561.1 FecR family protein [Dyadobacter chenwenxiniae]UON83238.1 FecR family protein [Dyadobacter chenwenxiniae]